MRFECTEMGMFRESDSGLPSGAQSRASRWTRRPRAVAAPSGLDRSVTQAIRATAGP